MPPLKKPIRDAFKFILKVLGIYLFVSYLLLPDLWRHYEHRPELQAISKHSFTKEGLPADPLNIALIATQGELLKAMEKAGWVMADTLSLKSDLLMTKDVLLRQSYPGAPISRLYFAGRPQDFGFEKEVRGNPAHRHHVRFWKTGIRGKSHRPVWIGSATFDRSVGFSHYTGQLTHHIAPDIDRERDALMADLLSAGQLSKIYQVTGVGPVIKAYNGSHDPYYTDGELTVGVVSPDNEAVKPAPVRLRSPFWVELKNSIWKLMRVFKREVA